MYFERYSKDIRYLLSRGRGLFPRDTNKKQSTVECTFDITRKIGWLGLKYWSSDIKYKVTER